MHQKFYLLVLLLAAACSSQRYATRAKLPTKDDAESLHCLKVTELFPYNAMQGKNRAVFLAHDTMVFYIYSYKDMILNRHLYLQHILDNEGNQLDSIRTQSYFVYKRGNTTGNLYDSLMYIINKRKNVDTAMELVWTHHQRFNNPDIAIHLVESQFDEATQSLMQKYTYYQRSDTSGTGSAVYFFSKKPWPKNLYSLWPAMDSAKQMRLYKCVETYNQRYFKKEDILADAHTSTQTAEIVPATDTAMVMHFFRQEEAWQKNNGGK